MANNAIFEKDKKEGYEIRIKLTPRNLERALFIIIILVLAYFAFWGKTGNCDTNDTTTKLTSTTETQKLSDTEKTTSTTNKTVNNTPKQPDTPIIVVQEEEKPVINTTNTTTHTNTTNTTQPAPQPKTYNGMINITVGDIESEKGTYESSGVEWGKITKVTFTIDNQNATFVPKIQIYTYNTASSTVMKNMIRGEVIYSPQGLGEKKEHSLDVESQPFTEGDMDKVVFVKVVLKDQSTDKIIQTIEKQYNFD